MAGPRDPGDAPRPLGEVPRGEGGRVVLGDAARPPLLLLLGEGGRFEDTPAWLGVGEGTRGWVEVGVCVVWAVGEVIGPGAATGERGVGMGVTGEEGVVGAGGVREGRVRGRVARVEGSARRGECLRVVPFEEGERWRRARGEVGGVDRFPGGEGVTRVLLPRLLTPPPTPPPREAYRRGLTDRCNTNINTL